MRRGLSRQRCSAAQRLREVHRLPYVAVRCASRRHPGAHRAAVDRCRRGAELVRRSAMSPTLGRWQVIVIEDADRITERGADALLKSIEEPAPRTVWILCAPTADDVVATVRSRCRLLTLQTPTIPAVARLLEARDGVEPELAAYAARVSQGISVGRGCWRGTRVLGTVGNRFCRSLFSCMGWARVWPQRLRWSRRPRLRRPRRLGAGCHRAGGTRRGPGIRHEGGEAAPGPGRDEGAGRTAAGSHPTLSAGCD